MSTNSSDDRPERDQRRQGGGDRGGYRGGPRRDNDRAGSGRRDDRGGDRGGFRRDHDRRDDRR
ncbi:tetratricopeptide repeat protein, partial [Streptomyces sp. PGLac3x]